MNDEVKVERWTAVRARRGGISVELTGPDTVLVSNDYSPLELTMEQARCLAWALREAMDGDVNSLTPTDKDPTSREK